MYPWTKAGNSASASDPNEGNIGFQSEYGEDTKGGNNWSAHNPGGNPEAAPHQGLAPVPTTPLGTTWSGPDIQTPPTGQEGVETTSEVGGAQSPSQYQATQGQPNPSNAPGMQPFDSSQYQTPYGEGGFPMGTGMGGGMGAQGQSLIDHIGEALIEKQIDGDQSEISRADLDPTKGIPQGEMAEFELKAKEFIQQAKTDIIKDILEKLRTDCKPTLERMAEDTIDPYVLQELRSKGWAPFVTQQAIDDIVSSISGALS